MRKNRAADLIWRTIEIYIRARVPRASAALAYYLLLSIFPILIVISSVLGMLPLANSATLMDTLNDLPPAIGGILLDYLTYVERNQSVALLSGGIFLTLTSSSAAFRGLMDIFGEVFGQRVRGGVLGFIFSLFLSVILIIIIYGGLVMVLLGDHFLNMIRFLLDVPVLSYSWRLLQLMLPFVMLLLFLALVYRLTARTPRHKQTILPGAMIGSFALVEATNLFARFLARSTRYTTVYGSLAAVIILMIWLFMCGNIIILGNIFNYAVAENEDRFGTIRLPKLPKT